MIGTPCPHPHPKSQNHLGRQALQLSPSDHSQCLGGAVWISQRVARSFMSALAFSPLISRRAWRAWLWYLPPNHPKLSPHFESLIWPSKTNPLVSLIFFSNLLWRIAEQLSPKNMVDASFKLHLLVSNSFMNFVYLVIWEKACTSGKLMASCLWASENFLNWASFMTFFNLAGYRTLSWYSHTGDCWGHWTSFPLLLLSSIITSYPEVASFAGDVPFSMLGLFSVHISTSLPLQRVRALSCSLGLA